MARFSPLSDLIFVTNYLCFPFTPAAGPREFAVRETCIIIDSSRVRHRAAALCDGRPQIDNDVRGSGGGGENGRVFGVPGPAIKNRAPPLGTVNKPRGRYCSPARAANYRAANARKKRVGPMALRANKAIRFRILPSETIHVSILHFSFRYFSSAVAVFGSRTATIFSR